MLSELVRLMQKYGGKIHPAHPLFRRIDRTGTEEPLKACLDEAKGEDRKVFEKLWYVTWPKHFKSLPNRSEMDHPALALEIRKKCLALLQTRF